MRSAPLEIRFWAKVVRGAKLGDCWGWSASKNTDGYGHLGDGRRLAVAHRLSWRIHNGPIPAGFCVLHRCDNPACSNPAHLFLGTQFDNIADRTAKRRGYIPPRATRCLRGHEYTEANTKTDRMRDGSVHRSCRTCRRLRRARIAV